MRRFSIRSRARTGNNGGGSRVDHDVQATKRELLRRAIAGGGALVGAAGVAAFPWPGMFWTRAIPTALFALSAGFVQTRSVGANVLARALWGSTALLAAIDLVVGPASERATCVALLAATVTALVAAGKRGLDEDAVPHTFKPVAFRWLLFASMLLAATDAHTLLFYGVAWLEGWSSVMPPLVLGILALVSAIGLFRMRAWGLFGTLAVNAVVLVAALTGTLEVPPPVALLLACSSFAQLLLPIPIIRAITARRRAPATATATLVIPRARFAPALDADDARDADLEAEADAIATPEPLLRRTS
jgi:hypothetical protein